jgi:hypothetical protein
MLLFTKQSQFRCGRLGRGTAPSIFREPGRFAKQSQFAVGRVVKELVAVASRGEVPVLPRGLISVVTDGLYWNAAGWL